MPPTTDDGDRYHHGNLRTVLLRAAEETLREAGADQLSLRDLARQAGVSHAAPRRHFRDRQALLDALAIAGFERLHAEMAEAVKRAAPDFDARLRAVAHTYTDFAERDTALIQLMFAGKHGIAAEPFLEAWQPTLELMESVLEEGRGDGPDMRGTLLLATLYGIAAVRNGNLAPPEILSGLVDAAVDQLVRSTRS